MHHSIHVACLWCKFVNEFSKATLDISTKENMEVKRGHVPDIPGDVESTWEHIKCRLLNADDKTCGWEKGDR